MNETTSAANSTSKLQPYLSPLAVWALSVGSAIGWGSLVVTSSSYLSQAGPMGSILGLLIGFAMMLMVSSHYHFLANRYPGTGGLYNYVKNIFGYDRAFLISWLFCAGIYVGTLRHHPCYNAELRAVKGTGSLGLARSTESGVAENPCPRPRGYHPRAATRTRACARQ